MIDFNLSYLKKLGLTGSISYNFSGQGDEGDWDIRENNLFFPDNFKEQDQCYQYFSEILMDKLPSGWELNYGSYGSMKINFEEEKVYFSVNERSNVSEIYGFLEEISDIWNEEFEYVECEIETIWDFFLNQIEKKLIEHEYPSLSEILPYLDNLNLCGADLWGVVLYNADLEGANLEGANLGGANLRSANLRSANLKSADLDYTICEEVNLEGANLEGASLQNANLKGANLKNANLKGADLDFAIFEEANLEGANLEGTSLDDVNLKSANLKNANLPKF